MKLKMVPHLVIKRDDALIGGECSLDQVTILFDDAREKLVRRGTFDPFFEREMRGNLDEIDFLPCHHGRSPPSREAGLVSVPLFADRGGQHHPMTEIENRLKEFAAVLGSRVHRRVPGRRGEGGVKDQHAGADLGHNDQLPASLASAAER